MYLFIQRVQEFKIKDLLYKRYSNVQELLKTFNDFNELLEFFVFLHDKSVDEEIYEYYLHKSAFSEISFEEFKSSIMTKVAAEKMTDEDVDNIMQEAFKYVKPKEVT